MKFTEGDEILAKPPNASEYHRGKILSIKGYKCRVQFNGGEEHTIFENDIKLERASRNTIRTSERVLRKSPSRHSPSRRKSPSRRSPARSPNIPTRKLPIRSVRIPKMSIPDAPSEEIKKIARDNYDPIVLISSHSHIRETGPVTRRSSRILSSAIKNEKDFNLVTLTRNIDRAASVPVERKSQLFESIPKNMERGMSLQRDQDLSKILHYEKNAVSGSLLLEKSKRKIDLLSKPQEFGGWLGALFLIIALPACAILPQITCSNKQCGTSHLQILTEWEFYLNLSAFLLYAGFLCFLAFVSVLPIGRLVDGQQNKTGRLQYRINGMFAAVLSLFLFGVYEYKGYKVSEFILEKSLQLSISGWLLGTILAIALYIKGGKASVAALNMYASTDNIIYDFWQGREINPRMGSLDFKIILIRSAVIGTLILNSAAIINAIEETGSTNIKHYNLAMLLVACLQIFYNLDMLIFESSTFTCFGVLYEGTGYMVCAGHLMYPFLPTLVTRYLRYHKNSQSGYLLVLFASCYLLGYILYRSSNSQKDEFRKNPLSLALSYLETIPTTRGKKLIASGLWGYVRHPNYLGDIIMQWSMACMCLTTDILAYYAAICCTLVLMYRALRDNARCKIRYGTAWEQYCSRVKFMILNRVF